MQKLTTAGLTCGNLDACLRQNNWDLRNRRIVLKNFILAAACVVAVFPQLEQVVDRIFRFLIKLKIKYKHMVSFFKELFEYSHHYNRELLNIFLTQPDKTSEKSVQLFNHMLNAHQIWNNRIQPNQPTYGVWQMHELQALEEIMENNYKETLFILDKELDLNQVISYKTSKGDPLENTIRDILFHVINHTTYHRAQIATEFKNNGLQPLMSDYIFYKR